MIESGLKSTIPAQAQRGHHHLPPAATSIFVIDDSPTIRKVIEIALSCEGYEVTTFHDGIEAIKWLVTPGVRPPDLMLVDIGLPKMDGYELIRRVRAHPRFVNTKYIILSGGNEVADKLKGGQIEAYAYIITKPFMIQDLLAAVRKCITGTSIYEQVDH